jgi:hypothetical protein
MKNLAREFARMNADRELNRRGHRGSQRRVGMRGLGQYYLYRADAGGRILSVYYFTEAD